MSVFSRFFHSRDKPEELRRAQDTLGGSRFSFFFGGSTSGKPVNERTALQMTSTILSTGCCTTSRTRK